MSELDEEIGACEAKVRVNARKVRKLIQANQPDIAELALSEIEHTVRRLVTLARRNGEAYRGVEARTELARLRTELGAIDADPRTLQAGVYEDNLG